MSYDGAVAADTPSVYYKMQETSGTTLTDASGNARNGVYGGTVNVGYKLNQAGLIASDAVSKSVLFSSDGTDLPATPAMGTGYASVTYAAWNGMNVTSGSFTAEIWAKTNPAFPYKSGVVSGQVVFARRKTTLQWELRTAFAGQGQFTSWAAVYAGGFPSFVSTFGHSETESEQGVSSGDYKFLPVASGQVATIYDGLSHHVVGVKSAGMVRLYVDGVASPMYWAAGAEDMVTDTTQPLTIGSPADTGAGGFIGYLSNAAMYLSALSHERILAHYQAGAGVAVFMNLQWALNGAQAMSLSAASQAGSGFEQLRSVPFVLTASATAATSIAQQQRIGVVFQDAASISSSVTTSSVLQMLLANSINVNAALGFNTIQQYALESTVLAGVVIQAGDETYNGWVINPFLGASVMVEGFDFTSFAAFRGKYYATKPDGLYRLGGDSDAGSPILSYIAMPKSNFGAAKMKRVAYAYIGAATDGTMVLRVIAGNEVFHYSVRNPTTDMAEQRIDIGRGIKANYWQFELMNPDGADFSLDTIKFLPVILERRI